MSESNQSSQPINFQIELAKRRNHIAADRTLLSWSRASVSLIGTGFAVDRVITKLYSSTGTNSPTPIVLVRIFSLAIMGAGILAIIMAALDYKAEMNRLEKPDYYYTPRTSIGMIISGILVVLAITAFITVWKEAVL